MLKRLYKLYRVRKIAARELPKLDRFLKQVSGIIHIGAHRGAERHLYESLDLDVVWVEADPKMFRKLKKNIAVYPKQIAINVLVSNIDKKDVPFNRASNSGASSSMLDFQDHAKAFPEVTMVRKLKLHAMPFERIAEKYNLAPDKYQGLIIDVQGAELKVLEGFGAAIKKFKYIKLEASDFPAYEGGATMEQLDAYLSNNGFHEISRAVFYKNEDLGQYFDVLYVKN